MRDILERRNRALLQDLDALLSTLRAAQPLAELRPYQDVLVQRCQEYRETVTENLRYLHLSEQQVQLIDDVFSETRRIVDMVRWITAKLASPVLRASPGDRLTLQLIAWLHREHIATRQFPAAFSDGDCAIFPFLRLAPVYFLPCVEQRGLRFLVLLFHEFGHLLYAHHRAEMDALVGELQRSISEILRPVSQRNDRYAEEQAIKRQIIIETWYKWAQEVFCDAVGLTIGGPSFLYALASHLSTMESSDFCWSPGKFARSTHPVTGIRLELLIRRARAVGYTEAADVVKREWTMLERAVDAQVDYHGYYVDTLTDSIKRILDDMLEEASPRRCNDTEAAGGGWSPSVDSPIRLLNWAWQVYRTHPSQYSVWEARHIAAFKDSVRRVGAAAPGLQAG